MEATAARLETHYGVEIPHVDLVVYTDDVRGWVVAKIRELADRMESRDLRGSQHQWDDNPLMPAFVMVETFDRPITINGLPKRWAVRLSRITFEPAANKPPSLALVKEG